MTMLEGSAALEIANDLFLLTEPEGDDGWFISLVVALGDEIGLMDTGYAHTPERVLFPFLEQRGRSPSEITCVVNSHLDKDHIEGNSAIREVCDAKFAMHELDAQSDERPDFFLSDGDHVSLGGRRFEILHTPGHRPGNICLYDPTERIALTGDTVMGTRRDLIRMPPEVQLRSLSRLKDLAIDLMVIAHPFQPLDRAILSEADARTMIKISAEAAREHSAFP